MSTRNRTPSLPSESASVIPDNQGPPEHLKNQFKADYSTGTELSLYAAEPPVLPEYISTHLNKDTLETSSDKLKDPHLPNPVSPDVKITLVKFLHGGIRPHTSQIWTATITSHRDEALEGKHVVAKFLDPLYYFDPIGRLDALQLVNEGVIGEHTAYTKLQSLQGTIIPQCFGLFVASFLPPVRLTPASIALGSRNVYVILLENVEGISLDNQMAKELGSAARDRIMDDVFEAEAQAIALGVKNNDLEPRNFLLRKSWKQDRGSTVVMIDFEDISSEEPCGEWNPSEIWRAQRIQQKRDDNLLAINYPTWWEDGWLGSN